MGFRWDKYEAWRKHPMLSDQLRVAGEDLFFLSLTAVTQVLGDMEDHLANLRCEPVPAVPGLKWGAAAFVVYVAYDMLTASGKKDQH